jgi:hypothetical protein
MATHKAQVSMTFDTAFARDKIVNTLYFGDIASTDWDALATDLCDIYQDHWLDGGAREVKVDFYDVESPAPHFPIGSHTRNAGVIGPASHCPREVALCLSYYAERNLPRQRGRIYLPITGTSHNPAMRPNPTIMNKALAMGGFFAALGGADIDWRVWSPTDSEGRDVTNTWVDDEWDTQRSRGLRATTRVLAAPGS